MTDRDHYHDGCKCQPTAAVQSLDEMEFERGIWTAALYNDIPRLKAAISKGCTNDRDNSCYTALHYAARSGNYEACKLLINANADVNATTNGGVTPLHRAAMMGREDIVKLLCENKAQLNIKDVDGRNALHRAAMNGHQNVVEFLLEKDSSLKFVLDDKGNAPCHLVSDNLFKLKSLLSF